MFNPDMKLLCIILYYSIETIFDFDQELWFSGNFVRHICTLLERKLRVGSEFSANKDVGSDSYQPTWPKSEVLTGNGSVHTSEINAKIQEETQHETFTSGAVLDWLCSVCKVSFIILLMFGIKYGLNSLHWNREFAMWPLWPLITRAFPGFCS